MQNLSTIHNLIVDMDGVLWRGDTPQPGIIDFFLELKSRNLDYVLATNNATRDSSEYVAKLARFGVDVPSKKIIGSAEATALYLRENFSATEFVFAIGEPGLHRALRSQGFVVRSVKDLMDAANQVDHVVIGLSRQCCYVELSCAVQQILAGASFIGTNPDVTYPNEAGLLPGAGALIAFVEAATGKEPTIIGKPYPTLFREALARLKGTGDNTVVVGDRINTDIAGGKRAGLKTILLLSGVTKKGDLAASVIRPDWVMDDIRELTQALTKQ
jgi:4-nitrophenyl phosphatase